MRVGEEPHTPPAAWDQAVEAPAHKAVSPPPPAVDHTPLVVVAAVDAEEASDSPDSSVPAHTLAAVDTQPKEAEAPDCSHNPAAEAVAVAGVVVLSISCPQSVETLVFVHSTIWCV